MYSTSGNNTKTYTNLFCHKYIPIKHVIQLNTLFGTTNSNAQFKTIKKQIFFFKIVINKMPRADQGKWLKQQIDQMAEERS